MSQVHKRGPASPEMNMTPLIDVVFLLIIFFMLVSRIVVEQSVEMIVPKPTDPNTRELTEDDSPIIVNVAPVPRDRNSTANPLTHSGVPQYVQVGGRQFLMGQLGDMTTALEAIAATREDPQVVVRSDVALFYEEVRPVLEAIRGTGIERVDLAALTEDAEVNF